jgi:uncharacterized hydrophobic protein (TIGR00271 family)
VLYADSADITRMRDRLLFDGADAGRKLTAFWTLLALASVIASAGVVGDSTATVIGAMIVAPLMTPILGTVLSIVTGDLRNLVRCVVLVVAGAAVVVAIAWLLGELVQVPIVAATNSQVAVRVHPRLIDLVAALATGAVGSYALIRSDVSDTLPGVAIAISLVPPLAVVGLTLESHRPHQAVGALLLFLTNVGAILLSGLVVMALYRVRKTAEAERGGRLLSSRMAAVLITGCIIGLAVPLAAASKQVGTEQTQRDNVTRVAGAWAQQHGWLVVGVDSGPDGVEVRAIGPKPTPNPQTLRAALDAAGYENVTVHLDLTNVLRANLEGR